MAYSFGQFNILRLKLDKSLIITNLTLTLEALNRNFKLHLRSDMNLYIYVF